MVLKVSKVLQELQDQQVLMGQLEQQDHKVLQDQQVLMVTMELLVQLVHRVRLVQLEQTETMELQDHKVLQDHKGLSVTQDLKELLDHKATLVLKELQVLKDQQVQLGQRDHKDQGLPYKVTHLQQQKVLYGLIMILVIIGYMFGMVQTGTLLLQDLLWSLSIYS
jgi:hypothetical protein